MLGSLHAVKSPKVMEDKLKKDELLRRYVTNIVASLTPCTIFGTFSGGITVGKHVSNHMLKAMNQTNRLDQ